MTKEIQSISALFTSYKKEEPARIEKLPQSGSDRTYYRIHDKEDKTFIATVNNHVRENEAFIYFTKIGQSVGAPMPVIFAVDESGMLYIQEDLGNETLLQVLEKKGHTEEVYDLFRKSLEALAKFQIRANELIDYGKCISSKAFGQQAILADLLYFKYYFLDTLHIPYEKEKLMEEFDSLSHYLSKSEYKGFMYRDFQSRNVMVKDNEIFFIDYQGGMQGAPQYDVASLLWQAKANLPKEWKQNLFKHYSQTVAQETGKALDTASFEKQYDGYVLLRLLQVLGAYGFRGLFERKEHFLSSIPLALQNLKSFLADYPLPLSLPLFESLLNQILSDDVINRFASQKANEETKLKVEISSFSYIQNGYPKNDTGNGGGFVFDCRGILNPGRIEEYKTQSGQDKPVKVFLENQTRMPDFLNSVFHLVDITIEDYMRRNFEHLQISFGCTGGQHRSVYAAEALNSHLKNKYGVSTVLNHHNKKNWVK